MENTEQKTSLPTFTPEEQQRMLVEIYENSRKTKNYMKWQLIITVALVIIPLLATAVLIPLTLKSLTSVYSTSGINQLTQ